MKKIYLFLGVFALIFLLFSCSQDNNQIKETQTGAETQTEKTGAEFQIEETQTGTEVKKEEKDEKLSEITKDLKEKLSDENKIWTVNEMINLLAFLSDMPMKRLPNDLNKAFDGQKIKIKGYALVYDGFQGPPGDAYSLLVDGPINTETVEKMKKLNMNYYDRKNAIFLNVPMYDDNKKVYDNYKLYDELLNDNSDYFVPMTFLGEIKMKDLNDYIMDAHDKYVTFIPFTGEKILKYDIDNVIDAKKIDKGIQPKKELSAFTKEIQKKLADKNKVWTVEEIADFLIPIYNTPIKDLPDDLDKAFRYKIIKVKGYYVNYAGLDSNNQNYTPLIVNGPINKDVVKEMKQKGKNYYYLKPSFRSHQGFTEAFNLLDGKEDYFVPMEFSGEIGSNDLIGLIKKYQKNKKKLDRNYFRFKIRELLNYDVKNAIDAKALLGEK